MQTYHYTRRYTGPLQAAIFDWAGTTVDYGCCAPAGVFVEVFRRRDVPVTLEEARGPMGMHKLDHLREMIRMPGIAGRWREVHGTPPGEEDAAAMFEEFVPLQRDCLADYADLIPGTLETIAACRNRGLKIGSTTGYNAAMMEIVTEQSKQRGYEPDEMVCVSDVPYGRPHPWMCLENAKRLGVYPLEAIVKIGDTVPDIHEGLNGGMWTIGLAKTGNEVGLTESQIAALSADELQSRLDMARARLAQAGAHYVVDGISDILPCLDDIESRLAQGNRP